jgi:hypothetical protein
MGITQSTNHAISLLPVAYLVEPPDGFVVLNLVKDDLEPERRNQYPQ